MRTEENVLAAPVAVAQPLSLPAPSEERAWPARCALAGLILLIAVVCVAATHTAVLVPATIRPLPSWLAGPFGHLVLDVGLGGTIALLAVMFAVYLGVLSTHRTLSTRTIVGAILGVHLIVAVAPPLFSTDVFSYGAYARMGAVYGISPYLKGPMSIILDHWYPFVDSDWVTTPSAYGPLFTLLGYPLAGLSIALGFDAYKWMTVAASLVTVLGVWYCAGRLGRDQRRALVLVGLNPVLLIYAVGGAHNDMIMLALLVMGIAAILSHRERLGGIFLILAPAIKLTALLVLPFALAARDDPFRDRQRRVLQGVFAASLVVCATTVIAFGDAPLRIIVTLEEIQRHGGSQSIFGFLPFVIGHATLGTVGTMLLNVICAIAVIGLLLAVRSGRMDWLTGAGWAFVVVLITSAYLLPWYATWCLPFAALSRDRRLTWAAIILSGIALTSL